MTRRPTRIRTVVAAAAVLGVLTTPAVAQEQGPAQDLGQLERATPTAPVKIDGVQVLRVRGVSSFPAEQRASTIAGGIRDLARNPSVRPESLRLEETDVATGVMADRQLVVHRQHDRRLQHDLPPRVQAGRRRADRRGAGGGVGGPVAGHPCPDDQERRGGGPGLRDLERPRHELQLAGPPKEQWYLAPAKPDAS
jgi:hypothetical protein